MYKYNNQNHNVVEFSYTNQEFSNFYDRHKSLCDEISGSKLVTFKYLKNQEDIEIKKENFIIAIKRLHAFIINYSHCFDDKADEKILFSMMFKLEEDFIEDVEYNGLIAKSKDLVMTDKVDFSIRYYDYLFRCFDIIVKTSEYLQKSMMIGTKNIKKLTEWFDAKPFFENLGNYRTEVSNIISNFVVSDVELHYKKILGYHYTYRLFVDYEELHKIDKIIELCNSYILNKKFMKFVFDIKENRIKQDKQIRQENLFLKRVLYMILKLTNKSLSNKNILPKINRKVMFDKTGI